MNLRLRPVSALFGLLLAGIAPQSHALNILLCNDDGFTAANIRALYARLKTAGHSVVIAAPVDNQSGRGGFMSFMTPIPKIPASYTDMYTLSATAKVPRGVSVYPALVGQPGVGNDPSDADISYVYGSPVMACLYGIDVKAPKKFGAAPDLVISGPNEGNNTGHINVSSGTVNNVYYGINRNLPTIGVSDYATASVEFTALTASSRAYEVADIVVTLVKSLVDNQAKAGGKLMPEGTGLNVNVPDFAAGKGSSLPFVFTNMGKATSYAPAFYEDLGKNAVAAAYGIPSGAGIMGIGMAAGGTILPSGVTIPNDTSTASEGNVVNAKSGVAVSVIEGVPEARRSFVEAMKLKLNALVK